MCTADGVAPFFIDVYRSGKRLTIKTDPGFRVASLSDTIGFDRVMVIGLSREQCSSVSASFPSIMCITTTTTIYAHPVMNAGRGFQTSEPTTAEPQGGNTDQVQQSPAGSLDALDAVIIWTAISGAIGAILTACILVSLVNLHARINTHARCNDPPMFAVSCCLKCLAVLLFPLHLCARCFKCTTCCLFTLDQTVRGTSPSFRA